MILGAVILVSTLGIIWPAVGQMTTREQVKDFSNLQAINHAFLTYVTQYDDFLIPGRSEAPVCLPTDPSKCNFAGMWHFPLVPYLTNYDQFFAPEDSRTGDPVTDAYRISYGYNYSRLSKLCLENDSYSIKNLGCPNLAPGHRYQIFFVPHSAAYADEPGRLITITDFDKTGRNYPILEAPDFWPSPFYSYAPQFCTVAKYFTKYPFSVGFATRYGGRANVLMLDGHAGSLTVQQALEGFAKPKSADCWLTNLVDISLSRWDLIHFKWW